MTVDLSPYATQKIGLQEQEKDVFSMQSAIHQFFRPHVIQDSLRILTVMAAFHDGKQQFWGIIL